MENTQNKNGMSENSLKNKLDMRSLIKTRYTHQTLTILFVFSSIIGAAYLQLIDKAVTGTLIGTAIGSAFKFPFRSQNSTNKEDEDKKP